MKRNQIIQITSVLFFISLIMLSANPVFGASIKVACVGDSITWGWGLSDPNRQSYPAVLQNLLGSQYTVKNFGTSGCTMLKQGDKPYWKDDNFSASTEFKPDIVVIILGSNDAKTQNWSHKADFMADFNSLIEHYNGHGARVYIGSPPPVYSGGRFGITPEVVNDQIVPLVRNVASSAKVQLIDIFTSLSGKANYFPDTVHPNADGCNLIAKTVAASLTSKIVTKKRLRVIMSSDFPPFPVTNSDPDDVQSMVRFLFYSNEFDVEGLIASAGTYGMVAEKKNILAVLAEYDKVDENLRKHDPDYPIADTLRSVTYEGLGNNHNISIKWGSRKQPWSDIIGSGRDSEASNAIIAAADKPDPRPIYIGVWGGPREIAQAIWDVKNKRSDENLKSFISKLRVFLIADQDATHGWLMEEFPDLFIIESRKTYQGFFGSGSHEWAQENIIKNHGPLCAIYPPRAAGGAGVIEGDSPSFMYLVSANREINDPEDPTQPSWGGQYSRKAGTNHYVDGPGGQTIRKWAGDFQAEFRERADWCIE